MHSALDASIYRALNDGSHFKAQVVDPKIYGPKWSLYRDIAFHPYRPALVVACSFLVTTYFHAIFSDFVAHSSVDVVHFMSRKKFPPLALQLCCNSLCYIATLFSLL